MKPIIASLFLLVLSANAYAALEIREFQASHGSYGPKRENLNVFANEEVFFRYTVTGVRTDKHGNLDIVLDELVEDSGGKTVNSASTTQKQRMALGGDSFTGQAIFTFPENFKLGKYKFTLKITDKVSGETTEKSVDMNLKATEFALVQPRFARDANGEIPAPAGGLIGETLHLSVRAVGLDLKGGLLDAEMNFQIYDKQNKPTMPEPITVTIREDNPKVLADVGFVRFKADFALNCTGEFTVKMTVTDKVAKKSVTFTSPLVVTGP